MDDLKKEFDDLKRLSELEKKGLGKLSFEEKRELKNIKGLREKSQARLWSDYERRKTEAMDVLVWSDVLAKEQRRIDFSIVQEELVNWYGKAKNEPQKKLLTTLIQCIWRIDGYYTTLETILSKSIIELKEERRMSSHKDARIRDFEDEIKSLKAQLSFYDEHK